MGCDRLAAHKKKASHLAAHIVFIDDTGLMLLPIVPRSWAPIGRSADRPDARCSPFSAASSEDLRDRLRRAGVDLTAASAAELVPAHVRGGRHHRRRGDRLRCVICSSICVAR